MRPYQWRIDSSPVPADPETELRQLLVPCGPHGTYTTVLSHQAWNYGQWRGMCVAFAGVGLAVVIPATTTLAMVESGRSASAIVAACGLALALLGAALFPFYTRRLPGDKPLTASRVPSGVGNGVVVALFLWAVLTGGVVDLLLSEHLGTAVTVTLCLAYGIGVGLLATSLLVAPAVMARRGREDFRRQLRTDPKMFDRLLDRYRSWRGSDSMLDFGPL